jgi:hypothetical protein
MIGLLVREISGTIMSEYLGAEDPLERRCERWRITYSQGGKQRPTCDQIKAGQRDWSHSVGTDF